MDETVAHWLGSHALGLFFGLLALSLLTAGVAWSLLHRLGVAPQTSPLAPTAFLGARLAIGFAVVVAAGYGFAEIAERLGAGLPLQRFDEAFSRALGASVSRPALQVFAFITHLGDPALLVALAALVAAALVWRGRRRLALAWLLALAGNAVLNPTLKAMFARVRPTPDHGLVTAHGFSFPSGHSSGAVVVYGMLAYVLVRLLPLKWHLPVVLAAAALALAVGCSRVFLQVHYPSDVAAGFAVGLAWLAVCVTSIELMRHYRRTRG